MSVDVRSLMARIAQLEALVSELTKTNAEQAKTIAEQAKTNAELRARLGQDSGNSHRPPSTDSPDSDASKKRKRRRSRRPTGRRRGGQKGHQGSTRKLVPADEVDRTEEHRPEVCQGCGESLDGVEGEATPERHQVFEIPPVAPTVTEYRLHACACPSCGLRNKADLPEDASWSAFGPRVHALVATLAGVHQMPRRQIQKLLDNYFGLTISLGAISDIERRVSLATTPAVQELAKRILESVEPTGLDETGWRQAGERRWLWAAITEMLAFFVIRTSRGGKVVTELIGLNGGTRTILTDRWSAYSKVPLERRQFCWSHLLRDFKKISEAPDPEAAFIGRNLLRLGHLMFRWWHKVVDSKLTRAEFAKKMEWLRARVHRLLERGSKLSHKKSAGTCRQLFEKRQALWTFVRVEGVEPTNNATERAIRKAVIWRKISLGTQSDRGARFVERMLSITETLRRQGRNVYDFILESVMAQFSGTSPPSLLPGG